MADRLPRAVLDVNVLLRIILSKKPEGVAAALWELLAKRRFEIVTSQPLLKELRETLLVPELADVHGWSPGRIEEYVDALRESAVTVPGIVPVDVPELAERDASDLPLIAAAVEAGAAIVTQDADLLDLAGTGLDIEILDPLQFLLKLRDVYRAS
jgi:putative PIN family toxin of toxin-antitoxin system